MSDLRIATRRSRLALAQARWVSERLQAAHPHLTVTLVPVTTSGDVDPHSPLTSLTEVGAFVRAVQTAVLDDQADLAVHSLKDLPLGGPDGLAAVYPLREEAADVVCGKALSDLDPEARVGTSSPRRLAQLRLLRDDLDYAEIRGNVDTRLAKVASGEFDAVVLAEAGLCRLGREEAISQRFSIDEMVPAPGQAALAIEGRTHSPEWEMAAVLDHSPTRRAVEAERRLLEMTGAGCRSALGAYATVAGGSITLTAFVADEAGPRRATCQGPEAEAVVSSVRAELGV